MRPSRLPMQEILIDLNNAGFAAAAGKQRLSAGDLDTTAIFGVLQMLRAIVVDHPGRVTCLHDGKSWRHAELPDYKAGREASPEAMALRARWKAAKPWVARLLPLLGVHQVLSSNMEADDLAARLRARHNAAGRDVLLVSGDKDWLQLVNDRTRVWNPLRGSLTTAVNWVAFQTLPSPKAFAERKALMGKALEMPGVGGIGEKTASALLAEWGSVNGFLNACGTDAAVYAAADHRARTLVDDPEKQAAYARNLRLAWLDHPDIPKAASPRLVKGGFDRGAFLDLCGELAFFSILRAADQWLAPFCQEG